MGSRGASNTNNTDTVKPVENKKLGKKVSDKLLPPELRGLGIRAEEIEIYHSDSEFDEDEYDVYVNIKGYDAVESFTITGFDKAKKKAKLLAKKYEVDVRENI